jgi:LysM repeat protein
MEMQNPNAMHVRARHVVQSGDSWTSIANAHGVTVHTLAVFNCMSEDTEMASRIGTVLNIPGFGRGVVKCSNTVPNGSSCAGCPSCSSDPLVEVSKCTCTCDAEIGLCTKKCTRDLPPFGKRIETATPEPAPARNTGGNASYWLAAVTHPKRVSLPYIAECEDIILALGMTFEEGCAFKAIWRRCAAKKLNLMKKNYDGPTYDAEKAQHYAGLMLHADKLAALGNQIVGMVGSSTGLASDHVPHHKS